MLLNLQVDWSKAGGAKGVGGVYIKLVICRRWLRFKLDWEFRKLVNCLALLTTKEWANDVEDYIGTRMGY
jgi:hypothetical protein